MNKYSTQLSKHKSIKGKFSLSPAKKIRFSNGEIVELNRTERRKLKIYNKDLERAR